MINKNMTPEMAKCMNIYFKENRIQMVIEYIKRCQTSILIKGMQL